MKISGQPYKKDFAGYVAHAQCCKQDLYIVQKSKKFREGRSLENKKGSGKLCSLWLVLSARPIYSSEYKNSLEKGKVYRRRLYYVSETFLRVHLGKKPFI